MADTSKIGKLLEQLTYAVAQHDRANPTHNTWGIGMAHFDVERLGLEDGEEILPGIILQVDGGQPSQFRILCDGQHDEELEEEEEEYLEVSAGEEIELPVIAGDEFEVPVYSPGPHPVPPTP
jgi:hypothetical protein